MAVSLPELHRIQAIVGLGDPLVMVEQLTPVDDSAGTGGYQLTGRWVTGPRRNVRFTADLDAAGAASDMPPLDGGDAAFEPPAVGDPFALDAKTVMRVEGVSTMTPGWCTIHGPVAGAETHYAVAAVAVDQPARMRTHIWWETLATAGTPIETHAVTTTETEAPPLPSTPIPIPAARAREALTGTTFD
jgi:hypothetical protein